MSAAPAPTFHPAPSRPRLLLPRGACDAHCHVFGPSARFPYAAGAAFVPADAPKERLFALHRMIGVERCAIVQSVCHGYDHRAVADALAAKQGAYVGIAVLPVDVDDATLQRLHGQGFRGLRFNFMRHLGRGAAIDQVVALTPRLAALGWHLQLHFEPAWIAELAPALQRASVPVVIDHIGRVDAALGPDHANFRSLQRLLERPSFWIKLSGCDRVSASGPPYEDAVRLARLLMDQAGDRVLWGTDWPHPNHTHVPDDGVLVDLIAGIAPTEAQRQALLVDNPQRLYRFPVPLTVPAE